MSDGCELYYIMLLCYILLPPILLPQFTSPSPPIQCFAGGGGRLFRKWVKKRSRKWQTPRTRLLGATTVTEPLITRKCLFSIRSRSTSSVLRVPKSSTLLAVSLFIARRCIRRAWMREYFPVRVPLISIPCSQALIIYTTASHRPRRGGPTPPLRCLEWQGSLRM
jgi:hypothetical protein